MSKVETRLREVGILLPAAPPPVASYVPYVIVGQQVMVSGQIPVGPEGPRHIGRLGATISLEEGQAAARLCAVNILAQLKAACAGNLDRVRRCLRLGVFVNAMPDFVHLPEVANGASDLMIVAFGEGGRHARAAVGASALPRGVAVEVEGLFEIT